MSGLQMRLPRLQMRLEGLWWLWWLWWLLPLLGTLRLVEALLLARAPASLLIVAQAHSRNASVGAALIKL
jgi:hypothetical protein